MQMLDRPVTVCEIYSQSYYCATWILFL
jgi:hypothetical protein